MKQFNLLGATEVFPGSIIMNNRAFNAVVTKGILCPFLGRNCFECSSPQLKAG